MIRATSLAITTTISEVTAPTPEPSSLLLFCVGLIAASLFMLLRRPNNLLAGTQSEALYPREKEPVALIG
jgi:hypothetical protein